ncbi:uncharacterized protein LOC21400276 [Morus notabilis]|nr:uncharacterized protein LOC21400276 [Morus notabilis]
MSTIEKPQKSAPKIVKLDSALKLAEQWVNNMTKAEDDEQTEVEARPSRLGLGAKVSRQSKIGPLKDPLERKLYAKLHARTKSAEESTLTANKDGYGDDSDDSEALESRTQVFDKKRAANPVTPSVQQTKKRRK